MNHATFIQKSIDAVKYYPNGQMPCERINTFAFLDDPNQLNDAGLGMKAIDRNVNFFSLSWEQQGGDPNSLKWDYPLLAVVMVGTSIENPFKTNKSCPLDVVEYDLILVDKLENQATANNQLCQRRDKNDIVVDCHKLLHGYFSYLNKLIYAEVNGADNGYYTVGQLDQMRDNEVITSYMEIPKKTNSFRKKLRGRNEVSRGVAYMDRGVYGVQIPLFMEYVADNDVAFDYTQTYDKNLNLFGNPEIER